VTFDLQVERVLTGRVASVVHVTHAWHLPAGLPTGTLRTPVRGIWFLSPDQGNVLRVRPSPAFDGLFVPNGGGTPTGAYAYSPAAPLADMLTFEVASGLDSYGDEPAALLEVLGFDDGPAIDTVLRSFMASPKPGFRAIGLTGLLARSRPGMVSTLTQLWPTIAQDPNRRWVALALRDMWRDLTTGSVAQLVASLNSTSLTGELREPAVRAVSAIHTEEALPFLAGLLVSGDPAERMRGVFGLASFANGCPVQTNANVVSMDYLRCKQASPYKTEETVASFLLVATTPAQEAAAVAFWQQWWSGHPELR